MLRSWLQQSGETYGSPLRDLVFASLCETTAWARRSYQRRRVLQALLTPGARRCDGPVPATRNQAGTTGRSNAADLAQWLTASSISYESVRPACSRGCPLSSPQPPRAGSNCYDDDHCSRHSCTVRADSAWLPSGSHTSRATRWKDADLRVHLWGSPAAVDHCCRLVRIHAHTADRWKILFCFRLGFDTCCLMWGFASTGQASHLSTRRLASRQMPIDPGGTSLAQHIPIILQW